jgi:hypothetical protein
MSFSPFVSQQFVVAGLAEPLRIVGLELPAVTALQAVRVHAELVVAI